MATWGPGLLARRGSTVGVRLWSRLVLTTGYSITVVYLCSGFG